MDEADPASVFIYRGETRDVAEAMGIDCSKFQGPIIPVIYNINLRNPGSQFLATTFEMRNKDVVYVANSVSVEASKFINYIRSVNSTINDPINTALCNAYTLKNVIQDWHIQHCHIHRHCSHNRSGLAISAQEWSRWSLSPCKFGTWPVCSESEIGKRRL